MAPKPKSGFKKCTRCSGTMSGTDPHEFCLKCLGPRQDTASYLDCQAMTPKALRQREQSMLLTRLSQAPQSRSRSRSGRRSRHHSHSRSRRQLDKPSSSRSVKSKKHRTRHRSRHKSQSPSRGQSSRHRTPEPSEDMPFLGQAASPCTIQWCLRKMRLIFD